MVTDTAVNAPALAESARARSAFYAFLSVHFTSLPDVPFVEQMRAGEVSAMLAALVEDDAAGSDIVAGASQMSAFLQATRSVAAAQLAEKLGVDRTRLYRGVTPTYGPPPPYEMVWSQTAQDVSLLQALATLYRELGLVLAPDSIERLDYAGVELDCMRELVLREAAAWEAGASEEALKLRATQQDFLNQHLAAWLPAYVARALDSAVTDFYKGHLLMLRGYLASEQQAVFLPMH